MTKKLVILLFFLGLVANTGCSSKSSTEEGGGETPVETPDGGAGLEPVDGGNQPTAGLDPSGNPTETPPAGGEIKLEEPTLEPTSDPNASSSASTPTPTDPANPGLPQESLGSGGDTTAHVTDPTPPSESSAGLSEPEKPKKKIPIQKIATAPWQVGPVWFNTVYFARPGDTLKLISTRIYGNADKVKELKKGNPNVAGRALKPGDKVYYNSPKRPEDGEKLITYYEDNNIPAKTYVAKKGDNLRTVSKGLLGYPEAWREVWSYNLVESKGALDEGTELKYWIDESAGAAAATIAKTDIQTPPMPPPPDHSATPPPPPPPPDMAANPPPPPPPPDMAANPPPPPPPPPDMAANPPPPPPPPDMAANPPPPPPPPPPDMAANPPPPPMPPGPGPKKPVKSAENESPLGFELDQDMMLALGLGGAGLIFVVVMFIRNKKRRQREFEQAMNETQVGT